MDVSHRGPEVNTEEEFYDMKQVCCTKTGSRGGGPAFDSSYPFAETQSHMRESIAYRSSGETKETEKSFNETKQQCCLRRDGVATSTPVFGHHPPASTPSALQPRIVSASAGRTNESFGEMKKASCVKRDGAGTPVFDHNPLASTTPAIKSRTLFANADKTNESFGEMGKVCCKRGHGGWSPIFDRHSLASTTSSVQPRIVSGSAQKTNENLLYNPEITLEEPFEETLQYSSVERTAPGELAFDVDALEDVILRLSDLFQFRVVMSEKRMQRAALLSAGLCVGGALLGRHYYGRLGMAVGGAAGALCAAGYIAVAMRDVWDELRPVAWAAHELVFDYLCGLDLKDYADVARVLFSNADRSSQLASRLISALSAALPYPLVSELLRT